MMSGLLSNLAFLSTPSARRATFVCRLFGAPVLGFLSTPSARRATRPLCRKITLPRDFYPRPPRGGRPSTRRWIPGYSLFLSTPSARRATGHTDGPAPPQSISIHALREEGDTTTLVESLSRLYISIHALREEGDDKAIHTQYNRRYFYPRPPRGGRPNNPAERLIQLRISIHALREEGDAASARFRSAMTVFLSTPSARRATHRLQPFNALRLLFLSTPSARRATRQARSPPAWSDYFYPRPPRGGRRERASRPRCGCPNFYPRPPRGGRQTIADLLLMFGKFLSTPSARRATSTALTAARTTVEFLSTPSARRATFTKITGATAYNYFYPRPPRGGRHGYACRFPWPGKISIHALREEGDQ